MTDGGYYVAGHDYASEDEARRLGALPLVTAIRRVCIECGEPVGALHGRGCRLDSSGRDYVDLDESAVLPRPRSSAATAVNRLISGDLIPEAETASPLRRCEMAAIWLSEATAELSDAIIDAKDGGSSFMEIGRVLGMTPEGVRQRYVKVKRSRM